MVFPAKRFCLVPSMEGVRWAFSCGTWLPSRAEWLAGGGPCDPSSPRRRSALASSSLPGTLRQPW
uniref:Uncharacterized protein n=1 Tax=Spermophilus dauricus TaxID=99837 RepID=A0A8C9PV14_SPEDA